MATTVTLKPNAIDISGSTSGTTTLQATAVAGTTTITLPAATDTLVGKATTDTLTNKTLTSPTITGGALNGTLGATTPSTVAATTISASSTATFAAGAVGTPSITTTGDTNTGIYFPAADTIAFVEGGAEAMRIDSAGNLGLGVTPSAWSGFRAMQIGSTTSLWSGLTAGANTSSFYTNNGYFNGTNRIYLTTGFATEYIQGSGQHIWYNAPSGTAGNAITFTQAMTLDASGNLGIGTSNPYKTLTVGSSDASSWITAGGNNVNLTISSIGSGGAVLFRTGGTNGDVTTTTERMRIDSSGNVGIGTTSMSYKLQVAGTDNNNAITSYNTASGNAAIRLQANSAGLYIQGSGTVDPIYFGNSSASGYIVFRPSSDTERMRIDSSGNLLLGVTSLSTAERFNCTKSAAGNKIAHFENTGNTNGDELLRTKLGSNANNTTSYHLVCSTVNDKLYIFGNGNVVNVNNSYGTLSDIKLKENVVDATPKLADVMQLKVRNFNLKTDPEHKQIGFIAQELEQVFPALIDETHDRAEDGSQLETTVKSIKTSVLLPILVKAIQELKAINDTQAETINALTARVVALESK